MERNKLIEMLRANRVRFDALLAQVDATRMLQPIGEDQHTGKDILAHLTAWEQRLIGWLEAAQRGAPPQIPEVGATWADMDLLNERTLAENRDRSLAEVAADSRRSFERLIATVERFSDADLTEPDRYTGFDVQPLWRRIAAGPGYGHYQAHLYDLLVRIPPAARYTPTRASLAAFAGVYSDEVERITIRLEGGRLLVSSEVGGVHARPAIALDATHFAYENGGMVTFFPAEDGGVSALECWSYILPRIKA
ncbi:MAG: ClbS/DfsB family four-helix bundle protein [Ktedonobacterales bacterium]|nr:ClbS/DfsB family four-helix bundle protein [Ktedonobacterales bacterium]